MIPEKKSFIKWNNKIELGEKQKKADTLTSFSLNIADKITQILSLTRINMIEMACLQWSRGLWGPG